MSSSMQSPACVLEAGVVADVAAAVRHCPVNPQASSS